MKACFSESLTDTFVKIGEPGLVHLHTRVSKRETNVCLFRGYVCSARPSKTQSPNPQSTNQEMQHQLSLPHLHPAPTHHLRSARIHLLILHPHPHTHIRTHLILHTHTHTHLHSAANIECREGQAQRAAIAGSRGRGPRAGLNALVHLATRR